MECEEGHAKYLNSFGTSSSHYNKDFRYSAINTAKHTQCTPSLPLKTSENLTVSDVFRDYRKSALGTNWLKERETLIRSRLISAMICKKDLTTFAFSFTCKTNLHFDNALL